MELTLDIGNTLQHLPTSISLVASVGALFFGVWLKTKKINVEDKVSSSNIQVMQVESLMKQINLLSDELDKTRQQLTDLHLQNVQLMAQLREANKRIGELEASLNKVTQFGDSGFLDSTMLAQTWPEKPGI